MPEPITTAARKALLTSSASSRRAMHSPTAALSSQNRPGRCGNHAVLRFYLLHEPVIVAAAWVIVRWNVPALAKYPALELVSFAATLAIYELAVPRYRPTRFLFGMEPRQSATDRPASPAACGTIIAAWGRQAGSRYRPG